MYGTRFGAMTHKQRVADFKLEQKAYREAKILDILAKLFSPSLLSTVLGIVFTYHAVVALAGKNTDASISVLLSSDIGLAFIETLLKSGWIPAAVFFVGLFVQRKFYHGKIEKLQATNVKLEMVIDKGRSSSMLTPGGDTRPEDK